jgi:ABC-2 type transport system permease protein
MELLQFSAFYRVNPSAFPMSLPQTVSYIWLQQGFLALFMVWFLDAHIFKSISDGGISYELARPVDLYNRWFCQSIAGRLAKAVLRCFPIFLVAFLIPEPFKMMLPTDIGQFLLFLFSTVLSLFVVVSFGMLIYISTLYTLSPIGVRIITAVLADFLAGGTVPLPFFPQGFRAVAELLPFAAMQNMPLRIYSGNIAGTDAVKGIIFQLFWLLVLTLLGKFLMKNAQRRIVVQGG